MNVCIDDFERRAALCIDGSRKSLEELVVELRTMLEGRLYVGEEVRFGSALNSRVGRVIDCIELQTAEGVQRKYTVLNDRKLHKNLDSTQLKRTREVTDEALTRFIEQTAVRSFITKVWSVDNWGSYEFAFDVNDYQLWKDVKDVWKPEQRSSDPKGVLVFLLLVFSPAFILFGVLVYSYNQPAVESLIEWPNVRLANDAVNTIARMNGATSDHFWKQLVTDEKVKLSDPPVLEGIAHLFFFKSSHSNGTTLREYIEQMPAEPPAIFFAFGDSKEEIKELPAVRSLIDGGHEVLLLTDPLDRKALQSITWFEGKTLMDARWYEHSKQTDG